MSWSRGCFFCPCRLVAFLTVLTGLAAFTQPGSAASFFEQVFSLKGGNWAGDAFTEGGLDVSLDGDRDALVASADQFLGIPARFLCRFSSKKTALVPRLSRSKSVSGPTRCNLRVESSPGMGNHW
ncbi:hypothetical protein HS121_17915 [bacterium]|nr:hypothetical protein [bacterium]